MRVGVAEGPEVETSQLVLGTLCTDTKKSY